MKTYLSIENRKFPLITGLICLLFVACLQKEEPKPFVGDKTFYTAAPNLLYFKNVRSSYYYRSRKPNSKKDLYDFRKFERTSKRPVLLPRIVNNWLEDETYIFLERNKFPGFADSLVVLSGLPADSSSQRIRLAIPTKKAQYEFAVAMYEEILAGRSLFILSKEEEWLPLYQDGD